MAKITKSDDTKPVSESLLVLAKRLYGDYGKSTVENRALPDYRDGLKPVHRRVLWSMHQLGLKPGGEPAKAARVVGDAMGKYHPHGDSSIYDAMVGMANLSVPIVDGEGNWGSLTDDAAAMRYTEARLTRYAQETMLRDEYLAVSPQIPNYDGKDKEPFYLPALLPNLIINGTYGIAVGVTGIIPPLELEPLIPLVEKYLDGTPITTKAFKKRVRFNYPYGGKLAVDDEVFNLWVNEGYGSLRFEPSYELDMDTRTVSFLKVPPMFNWDLVVKRLAAMNNLSGYDDLTSKNDAKKGLRACRFVVRFKNTVAREDLEDALVPVIKAFSNSVSTATNYTLRHTEAEIEFRGSNIPNLLSLWTDYRVDLEKRAQTYIIGVLDGKLSHQRLMMLAVDNRKTILAALDNTHPDKVLIDKLKITPEQANTILSLQVRSLSRLNGEQIKATITKLQADRKQSVIHRDKPGPKVMSDMNHSLRLLAA